MSFTGSWEVVMVKGAGIPCSRLYVATWVGGTLRKPKAKEAVLQISNGSQLHFMTKWPYLL